LLLAASSASAEFIGIEVVPVSHPYGFSTWRVYAAFDAVGQDRMVSVAGTPSDPLSIEVIGGTFYQHGSGGDTPPDSFLFATHPELEYDTFVTIGKLADDTATILVGWPGFDSSYLGSTNTAWSVTPDDPQGEPAAGMLVLLGQFSTADGTGISGAFLIQTVSDGVPDTRDYVTFSTESPAIPAVSTYGIVILAALLVGAGVIVLLRRSRRQWAKSAIIVLVASTIMLAGAAAFATGQAGGRDCPADIDGDGDVDMSDLLAVMAAWGSGGGIPEDVNGDGMVDVLDWLDVLGAWGTCP